MISKIIISALLISSTFITACTPKETSETPLDNTIELNVADDNSDINLARLSITSVNAGLSNGGRKVSSSIYGVLGLFDDGSNIINGFNYDYWLTGGGEENWVRLKFLAPVIISDIILEIEPHHSGDSPSGYFVHTRGAAEDAFKTHPLIPLNIGPNIYSFKNNLNNISEIVITITDLKSVRIDELKIMGSVETELSISEGKPTIDLKIPSDFLEAFKVRQKRNQPFPILEVGGGQAKVYKNGEEILSVKLMPKEITEREHSDVWEKDEAVLLGELLVVRRGVKGFVDLAVIPSISSVELYFLEAESKKIILDSDVAQGFIGNSFTSPSKDTFIFLNGEEGLMISYLHLNSEGEVQQHKIEPNLDWVGFGEEYFDSQGSLVLPNMHDSNNVVVTLTISKDGSYSTK